MNNKNQQSVVLRDMVEADIENYVRWFTTETKWCALDTPWEPLEHGSEEEERKNWTEYFMQASPIPPDAPRWKYEIEANGVHVGWVSQYRDLEFLPNPHQFPAVGIDLAAPEARGKGIGTAALSLFLDKLREQGFHCFYLETWSGNGSMLRVAEKLGFHEVFRKPACRSVGGRMFDAVTFLLRDL
ncbi:MAG: GNAT family N-acetyltransferase [Clostridia bacterium]|nr:GNAT family N-acetyltransferase [Clostridia bacterium]